MAARWLAFVIWAAVAATVVFWGLRLFVAGPDAPPNALAAEGGVPPRADLSRLFGATAPVVQPTAASPELASRFKLVGVAAPKGDVRGVGVALIAVDGKPARAYRIGAALDSQLVLQSVHTRGASLGPREGPAQVRLDLPPRPAAATGVLPTLTPEQPSSEEAPAAVEETPPDIPAPSGETR